MTRNIGGGGETASLVSEERYTRGYTCLIPGAMSCSTRSILLEIADRSHHYGPVDPGSSVGTS